MTIKEARKIFEPFLRKGEELFEADGCLWCQENPKLGYVIYDEDVGHLWMVLI